MEEAVNKNILYLLIFSSLQFYAFSPNSIHPFDKDTNVVTKFIIIGHAYSAIKNSYDRKLFINSVNSEHADYVFILGDSDIWQENVYNDYVQKIRAKLFFSPGNHDLLQENRAIYKKIIGYLNKTIVTLNCNFILLNSSESIQNINNYIEKALLETNQNNPTVILTHHPLWDDNVISNFPYQMYKSYLFSEMLPIFNNQIDYIFAGSRIRQFFGRQYHFGKKVVYWKNVGNEITCYSCGMNYEPSYTIVEIKDRKLNIYPQYLKQNNAELLDELEALEQNKNSTFSRLVIITLKNKIFWTGIVFGIFLTGFVTILFIKLKKTKT